MRARPLSVRLKFAAGASLFSSNDEVTEPAVRLNSKLYEDLCFERDTIGAGDSGFYLAIKLDERSGRPCWDSRPRGGGSRQMASSDWTVVAANIDENIADGIVSLDNDLRKLWEFTNGDQGSELGMPAQAMYHQPIVLKRILLESLKPDQASLGQQEARSECLPVFRQGSVAPTSYSYGAGSRILLTSPVCQGVLKAGMTEVVIATSEEVQAHQQLIMAHDSAPSVGSLDSLASRGQADSMYYQFDPDAFLSSSLGMEHGSSSDTREDEAMSDEDIEGSERDTNSLLLSSGQATPRQSSSPILHGSEWEEKVSESDKAGVRSNGSSRHFRFQAIALDRKPQETPAATTATSLDERIPQYDQDDESRCWLTLVGIASAGLFAGDWVLLRLEGGGSIRAPRLARVGVIDDAVSQDLLMDDMQSLPVFLPPALLHNARGNPPAPEDVIQVLLSPVPSPNRTPTLPLAKSLLLARIATPHSVDNRYEGRFSTALREHFLIENKPRLRIVRRGDVIAVPIYTGYERSNEDLSSDGIEERQDLPDELVYFTVSYITPETLPQLEDDFESSVSSMSRAGELGCWVDSDRTKIATVGLESGRGIAGSRGWWCIAEPPATSLSGVVGSRIAQTMTLASRLPSLQLPILVKGARGSGKSSLIRGQARSHGLHLGDVDCFALIGDTPVKTIASIQLAIEKAQACAPSVLLLRHIEALGQKEDAQRSGKDAAAVSGLVAAVQRYSTESKSWPMVIVATTSDDGLLPQAILSLFKVELEIKAPSESDRLAIIERLLGAQGTAPDVDRAALAAQTAGMHVRDLAEIIESAKDLAMQTAMESHTDVTPADILAAGLQTCSIDIGCALDTARVGFADSIGAPKIPNVSWDDVGGLASVKQDILDTVQLPLERPELFAAGLKKRSGILLYGPPGTGKTLLAKAVATSCSLNFFSVKGPELLNKYIGESEANVRRVFQRARDAQPCVIFMDELDSIAPKRGNQGDSGGVMDRIVSQLLAELDGMSEGQEGPGVFVMAATNRPDLLDSSLLRPGRFDRMLYLSVSTDHESQFRILQALTRKFKLSPDLDLREIAERCPFNYTGADFYALCSDAMLKAITRIAGEVDGRIAAMNVRPAPHSFPHPLTPQYYLSELASPSELEVIVGVADFTSALKEMVPSVSAEEMRHYEEVQRQFSKETINAKVAMGPGGELAGVDGDEHGNGHDGKAKGKGKGKQKAE